MLHSKATTEAGKSTKADAETMETVDWKERQDYTEESGTKAPKAHTEGEETAIEREEGEDGKKASNENPETKPHIITKGTETCRGFV